MEGVLITFAKKYNGNFNKIYNALKYKEIINDNDLTKANKSLKKEQIKSITIMSNDYPEWVKDQGDAPFNLFYKGNISLLNSRNITKIAIDSVNELHLLKDAGVILEMFKQITTKNKTKDFYFVTSLNQNLDKKLSELITKMGIPIIYVIPMDVINKKQIILEYYDLVVSPFINDGVSLKDILKFRDCVSNGVVSNILENKKDSSDGWVKNNKLSKAVIN